MHGSGRNSGPGLHILLIEYLYAFHWHMGRGWSIRYVQGVPMQWKAIIHTLVNVPPQGLPILARLPHAFSWLILFFTEILFLSMCHFSHTISNRMYQTELDHQIIWRIPTVVFYIYNDIYGVPTKYLGYLRNTGKGPLWWIDIGVVDVNNSSDRWRVGYSIRLPLQTPPFWAMISLHACLQAWVKLVHPLTASNENTNRNSTLWKLWRHSRAIYSSSEVDVTIMLPVTGTGNIDRNIVVDDLRLKPLYLFKRKTSLVEICMQLLKGS